jgi:enolase
MIIEVEEVQAFEILDSRARPTVCCGLKLKGQRYFFAKVPSGASKGSREALELRDNDDRYMGWGVRRAISSIEKIIAPEIKRRTFKSPQEFDEFLISLDSSGNKSNLGANAILACSMALWRSVASLKNCELFELFEGSKSLPVPMINLINGGAHADNQLEFQEFMIVPNGFPMFSQAIQASVEVFMALKQKLKAKGFHTALGDEGGFAPNLQEIEALEVLSEVIHESRYQLGEQISLAIDVAATELWDGSCYRSKKSSSFVYTPEELINYYNSILSKFKVISIEDPFAEFDHQSWRIFTSQRPDTIIIGDDLYVTNPKIIKEGIDNRLSNGVLIKLNQIGTVLETLQAIQLAQQAGWKVAISHRSGETEDTFIADLAVGVGADFIKTGSVARSERTAKYNRLLEISHFHPNLKYKSFC